MPGLIWRHVPGAPGGRGPGGRRWSQEFDKDFVQTRQPSSRILISRTVNPPHGSHRHVHLSVSPSPLSVLPLPAATLGLPPCSPPAPPRRHGGRPVGRPAPARHQLGNPQSAINVAHHVSTPVGQAWSPAQISQQLVTHNPGIGPAERFASSRSTRRSPTAGNTSTRWPHGATVVARTLTGLTRRGVPSPIWADASTVFRLVSATSGNGQLIYPIFPVRQRIWPSPIRLSEWNFGSVLRQSCRPACGGVRVRLAFAAGSGRGAVAGRDATRQGRHRRCAGTLRPRCDQSYEQ